MMPLNKVQSAQNFQEIRQMKNLLGTLLVLLKAGIDLPSKIPINILPASSFKYKLSSKSLRTGIFLGKIFHWFCNYIKVFCGI